MTYLIEGRHVEGIDGQTFREVIPVSRPPSPWRLLVQVAVQCRAQRQDRRGFGAIVAEVVEEAAQGRGEGQHSRRLPAQDVRGVLVVDAAVSRTGSEVAVAAGLRVT